MAALYFGKEILIPLALAVLLSFVLSAAVRRLEIWRVGRVPSVALVLLLTIAIFTGIGWVVSNQLLEVVSDLPQYKQNIQRKLEAFRSPQGGSLAKATRSVEELSKELSTKPPRQADGAPEQGKIPAQHPAAVPVEVTPPAPSALAYLRNLLAPVLAPLAAVLIVIVFTLVLLIRREDLRDRILRLIGISQLTVATEAFDDATQRVSSYLRMQFTVNSVFAAIVALALHAIGLPGALLWGVLAGMLRFVPYVGPVIGCGLPFLVSLAVFSGWTQPLLTLGLFLVIELTTAYIVEPWLYGHHTGISSLAILVAAAFWSAIWGPVGLILSTPLTVCLVVLGRYVPQFEFLAVLLGDEPVLPTEAQFYQRLLAMDQHEARGIIDGYLEDHPVAELYDTVLIPALSMAEADRHRGVLDKVREEFLMQSMAELIAELADSDELASVREIGIVPDFRVVCLPAKDQADELAAGMLAQLLEAAGMPVIALPAEGLQLDLLAAKSPEDSNVVCISAVPPFALLNARSLSRKLKDRFANLKILVGVWSTGSDRRAEDRLDKAVQGDVVTTLAEAVERIRQMVESSHWRDTPAPVATRK